MNRKEAKRGEIQNCIRCAKCVSACPMGLEPYLLSALAENTDLKEWNQKDSWIVSSAVLANSLVLPIVRYSTIVVWVKGKLVP